jgi:hypothetical protein
MDSPRPHWQRLVFLVAVAVIALVQFQAERQT